MDWIILTIKNNLISEFLKGSELFQQLFLMNMYVM